MKTRAALLVETARPVVIEEIDIPALKPGQVLVNVAFSGVCHTQLLECDGHRGVDPFLPHCLGHEGSGTVAEIGPGVTKVAPGDRVLLSWMKGSGGDVPGTTYKWGDKVVNAGGITTWSDQAVISENRLTRIPDALPMREAALLGCAVPTGLGVVFNTLQAGAGSTLAVFGCGGIGLCAIAAARSAGCSQVIGIDVSAEKLALATQMGATAVISAAGSDPVAEILKLVPRGVDYAVESSGRPLVMAQALSSVRNQGGAAVIVGNAHHGEKLELDPKQFNQGKRLLGTWGGDNVPDRDFPKYASMVVDKRLNFAPLVGRIYSLDQVNEALSDLRAGKMARPIIEMAPAR